MLIGLALAVALTAWVALQEDDSAVEPVRREGSPRAEAPPRSAPSTGQPKRANTPSSLAAKPASESSTQLLVQSVAQWQARQTLAPLPGGQAQPWASQMPPPPPPVQVMAAEAAPPMAPPFPHAWVGRFDDETTRAIVSSPDQTWVLAVGDVIDGQWRIDQIQERQMSLTYLPLQQRQTVAMKAP
jgi:hypothetical protein